MSRETAYIQVINNNNIEKVAEVGVWNADLSVFALNQCSSIKKYYLIDPLQESTNNFAYDSTNNDFPPIMSGNRYVCNMGGETKNQHNLDQMHQGILSRISQYPSAEFIREESVRASKRFKNNSLDMVFIDAIHLYENVKEDIQAWLPKIKSGGIISGDDYSDSFPGVIKAVQEIFGKNFAAHDNIWYTTKK